MNAWAQCRTQRFGATVDILRGRAGKTRDARALHAFRDREDRLEIAFRGHRETSLDNIDAHCVEEARHLQLLLEGHRGSRRLFAVAQGRVEYDDRLQVLPRRLHYGSGI